LILKELGDFPRNRFLPLSTPITPFFHYSISPLGMVFCQTRGNSSRPSIEALSLLWLNTRHLIFWLQNPEIRRVGEGVVLKGILGDE
jgi:hypothetical protein